MTLTSCADNRSAATLAEQPLKKSAGDSVESADDYYPLSNDGDKSCEDEKYNDEGDDAIDPVYQADVLRQLQVDWLHQREYASLRLRILSDEEDQEYTSIDSHRIYYLMEQFLAAESVLFRDLFSMLKQGVDPSIDEDCDRFVCLRIDYLPADSPAPPLPLPPPPKDSLSIQSPLPGLLPEPIPLNDEQLPLFTLFLPYPEFFDDLLQLIYSPQHDSASWARKTLSPSTLGKMFLNLHRLECRSEWLISCIRYFAEIEANKLTDPNAWAILQQDQEAFQEMTRLQEIAIQHRLL